MTDQRVNSIQNVCPRCRVAYSPVVLLGGVLLDPGPHVCATPASDALRAARSASQQVRDDTIRAECVLLRDKVADLRAKLECSQLALGQALNRLEATQDKMPDHVYHGFNGQNYCRRCELDTARTVDKARPSGRGDTG